MIYQSANGELLGDSIITINGNGMNGGCRKKKDCCAYFGTRLKNEDNVNVTDFIIKNYEPKFESKNPLVFVVYYLKGKLFS